MTGDGYGSTAVVSATKAGKEVSGRTPHLQRLEELSSRRKTCYCVGGLPSRGDAVVRRAGRHWSAHTAVLGAGTAARRGAVGSGTRLSASTRDSAPDQHLPTTTCRKGDGKRSSEGPKAGIRRKAKTRRGQGSRPPGAPGGTQPGNATRQPNQGGTHNTTSQPNAQHNHTTHPHVAATRHEGANTAKRVRQCSHTTTTSVGRPRIHGVPTRAATAGTPWWSQSTGWTKRPRSAAKVC